MTDPKVPTAVVLSLDRGAATPIAEQIFSRLRQAILDNILQPGARLPSGRDLSVQLGVARGTVRAAYERLIDEGLIFSAGAAGTRVAKRIKLIEPEQVPVFERPLARMTHSFSGKPLPFEMGVPAQDAFPAKVWARMRTRAVREDALAYTSYADPRGEPALRAQIATQLAISRQIQCVPDQVIITSGYRHGLALALRAINAYGRSAWFEEPGYPIGRRALELAGHRVEPIDVDENGLRVEEAIRRSPDAAVALVTPGQQAPLGVPLSAERRRDLLRWAETHDAWILEDDYLSELQLQGRSSPALSSGDGASRVVHIGTFSKTLSPSLGLGFVVAPPALVDRIVEVAAMMAPAPNRTSQLAIAEFLADGHYLRHLRQMKALYAERRDLLHHHLGPLAVEPGMAGMALLLRLPDSTDDVALACYALEQGLAPAPLSPWYAHAGSARRGLLLSVTNIQPGNVEWACQRLRSVLARASDSDPVTERGPEVSMIPTAADRPPS